MNMTPVLVNAVPVVNLLDQLQSKSQVDCDSLNLEVVKEFGPFKDCTSNQADAFFELSEPRRRALLEESTALSRKLLTEYPGLTYEELALEIAMVKVSLTIAPLIQNDIFIMVNPKYAYSTEKVFEYSKRIDNLCRRSDPSFDPSRLCIKVPATWEGLQACRKLKSAGIRTLATTLFTMEQAILAAEVGCDWISPFVHELRAHFDENFQEGEPNYALCVKAQRYYERHSYATRVKAASITSANEVMLLAGVAAITLPPAILYGLRATEETEARAAERSLFGGTTSPEETAHESFVEDEAKFRERFNKSSSGNGLRKTTEAINLFCEFQDKGEALMRENDPLRSDGVGRLVADQSAELAPIKA